MFSSISTYTSYFQFSGRSLCIPCLTKSLLSPQVYCSGMQTDSPKEYVTLVNGDAENFSEVYGYR